MSCNFYSHVYLPNYIVQPVFGKLVLFYYSAPKTKQKSWFKLIHWTKNNCFPIQLILILDLNTDMMKVMSVWLNRKIRNLRLRNITTSPLQNQEDMNVTFLGPSEDTILSPNHTTAPNHDSHKSLPHLTHPFSPNQRTITPGWHSSFPFSQLASPQSCWIPWMIYS